MPSARNEGVCTYIYNIVFSKLSSQSFIHQKSKERTFLLSFVGIAMARKRSMNFHFPFFSGKMHKEKVSLLCANSPYKSLNPTPFDVSYTSSYTRNYLQTLDI